MSGTWGTLPGATLSFAGPRRSRICAHSKPVVQTVSSYSGRIGQRCCAAGANCDYRAADVFFFRTSAPSVFPSLTSAL